MASEEEGSELLFFDTFSHEINEEVNLDLVQFPKPVYITELRIIPLGARVEADFPGGVRLGATNPSTFDIDFFVNDLTKPGASTFEKLGSFKYNQNDCINMVCEGATTIPTDGLVLRGCYTTITLAVYGTLTKNIMEQIASPPSEIVAHEAEKEPLVVPTIVEEPKEVAEIEAGAREDYTKFVSETPPKDPRQFPGDAATGEWTEERGREVDWDKATRSRRSPGRRKSETRRSFSRSSSRDENLAAAGNNNRDWSRSPEFHNNRRLSRSSGYEASFEKRLSIDEARKRPRTPPLAESLSPGYNRRPRSPDIPLGTVSDDEQRKNFNRAKETVAALPEERLKAVQSPPGTPLESPAGIDEDLQAVEQFELIESDEEIGDDMDQFDYEFEEYEESMKIFNPMDLQRFESEIEARKLTKEFEVVVKILSKLSGIRKTEFEGMSRDERENWVHGMERVNQHLAHVYNFQRAFTEPHVDRLMAANGALVLQSLIIGLDYDCAMSQVAYKVRHLKVGLKFAELICCYDRVAHEVLAVARFNVFRSLFELYNEPFMAMSLQMMILKTVASILDTKSSVLFFLAEEDDGPNYYQKLLKLIESNPKIYLKFALKAIVKKLNVFETLEVVKEAAPKVCAERGGEYEKVLEGCLSELVDVYLWNDLGLSHSKHFVPVPQKIEIFQDEMTTRSVAHAIDSYFRAHALLESLSLLVVNRNCLSMMTNRVVIDLLKALARDSYGFLYLVERFEATMVIVRSILQHTAMEEWGEASNEWLQLGVEIAYKLQTKFHLDAIQNLTDEFDIVDHLTALCSLMTACPGRPHVIGLIGMSGYLSIIRDLIESEKLKVRSMESSTKYKSPILSYSVDVLDYVLRHGTNMKSLQEQGKQLLAIVKSYDIFESNVSAMLQELVIYLKPLDQPKSVFSYDDTTLLCDLMKKSFEFFTTFPGDLITCLRIARFMAIPNYSHDHGQSEEDQEVNDRKEYKELKHRLFLVQFYASEGYSILVTILEKIATHFQQPKMHSSNLVGNQGLLVLQVLLPTVQVLRRVLMMVIEARNIDFKDLTAVVPLLNIYNLLHNIPASALCYQDAQRTQVEIVKTLLCYTQPSPPEGVDNDSVMKSLWSQVIGEVIKFTLTCPSTFIPGLSVLSEMLPLPLPLPTAEAPLPREIQRILTERQLWCAHLHPQINAIAELIQTLCPTSYAPLSMLLVRVCLQMAELGPNMSVVVARTFLDLFVSPGVVGGVAGAHHLKLMNYLGNLVGHASIKTSVLSLLTPKLMDMWNGILTTSSTEAVHQQTQESILIMFQSLLDCENSFYSSNNNVGHLMKDAVLLASVIPTVEVLQGIVNSCLDHVLMDGTTSVLPVLRNLMLFTEHDVTIRILRSAMEKRRLRILATFRRLVANFAEISGSNGQDGENSAPRNIIASIIELLRLLITIEPASADEVPIPSRTITLTGQQLGVLLSYWTKEGSPVPAAAAIVPQVAAAAAEVTTPAVDDAPGAVAKMEVGGEEVEQATTTSAAEEAVKKEKEDVEIVLKNPILELREYLEVNRTEANDPILDKCNEIISYLESARDFPDDSEAKDEKDVFLPPPEGIVAQYATRQVYVLIKGPDERLNLNYWLSPPNYEEDLGDMEQIACDLTELIKTCLPADTNLVADCKRILNLSVSPQSNRERTVTAPCFRTRRIEMEPIGRMEKKMFGKAPLRGRGFPRTPPSRGDLFRSRPPNTSRPPSLHVDDFLALEGSGVQLSGPTGYNKSGMIGGMRGRGRGRGAFQGVDKGRVATSGLYRQSIPTWSQQGATAAVAQGDTPPAPQHFRTATQTPQYGNDTHHYHRDNNFVSHPRGRGFYRNRNYPR